MALVTGSGSTLSLAGQQGPPTFREAVDVIEVDVRVVTKAGVPIPSLAPSAFEVTIGGKQRRVVSADFVRYDAVAETTGAAPVDRSPAPTLVWQPAASTTAKAARGRIYMLYVDTDTFDVVNSRNILTTAASFVERLQPNDQIGLSVFPVGSQVDPTTDHKGVLSKLAAVVGTPNAAAAWEFALRPSEVAVLSTATGSPRPDPRAAQLAAALCSDAACGIRLRNEVQFMVQEYESQAQHQLHNIRALLKGMAPIPGHKTLVILSGGVPTTSRPGARPDIANIDMIAGQEAQRADTAIYALFVDWHGAQLNTAENRRGARFFTSLEDDRAMYRRSLDVFVGSSGGTLLTVLSGRGEAAFDQILRETSAYYVLGVEPAEADRDGKAKQLTVKVNHPGAGVQGSRWVTVPKRTVSPAPMK